MKLDKTQIELFNQNGFIIIDNFFNQQEISDFQISLEKLIKSRLKKINLEHFDENVFHEGLMELENYDHSLVADLYDTVSQTTDFKRLTTKKELSSLINKLMGRDLNDPLYTYTCRCRIDPPKDDRRTYGWHQEVFYSIPNSRYLQTWAPLVDNASKENGTIEVCIGSHKEGIAPQSWNEINGRAVQIIVDENVASSYKHKIIEMKVGSLMVFDYRLFHRSGGNISNRVRYSLVGMFHDATNPDFYSANINFGYKNKTPREYFDEIFPSIDKS
jgi:ectoine hydroxylase-related dioxygenase (phytanoyl-CoA dioxygenase family)